MPWNVRIRPGSPGSAPSLRRTRETQTRRYWRSSRYSGPQTLVSSSVWSTTLPALAARCWRSSHSVRDSWTSSPSRVTMRRSRSISTSSNASTPEPGGGARASGGGPRGRARRARPDGTAWRCSRRRRGRGPWPCPAVEPLAVSRMTGTGRRSRSWRMTSMPSRSGMTMSSRTMSGRTSSALASASSPPFAVTTRKPSSGQGDRDELGDAGLVVGDEDEGLGAHRCSPPGSLVCAGRWTGTRDPGGCRRTRGAGAGSGRGIRASGATVGSSTLTLMSVGAVVVPRDGPGPDRTAKNQMPSDAGRGRAMTPRMAPIPVPPCRRRRPCRDRGRSCGVHPFWWPPSPHGRRGPRMPGTASAAAARRDPRSTLQTRISRDATTSPPSGPAAVAGAAGAPSPDPQLCAAHRD